MPPKKRIAKGTGTGTKGVAKTTASKGTKRTATAKHGDDAYEPPSTRLTRRAATPKIQPKATLRPPPPTHEIIELSSTSPSPIHTAPTRKPLPSTEIDPSTDTDNLPSSILPTDSTQDIIITSIEPPTTEGGPPLPTSGFTLSASHAVHDPRNPPPKSPPTGLKHYLLITSTLPYPTISTSFAPYISTPPPHIPLRPRLPTPEEQDIDLGPLIPGIDYYTLPTRDFSFRAPVYAGATTNPLIPLAVLKLAERNLPFVEWGSDGGFVPNAVGQHLTFPEEVERGVGVWLEGFEGRERGDGMGDGGGGEDGMGGIGGGKEDVITVLFFPHFFTDGRHALLYFTRKSVSGRFAALVCAPCTTGEMGRLGLLGRVAGFWEMEEGEMEEGEMGEREMEEREMGEREMEEREMEEREMEDREMEDYETEDYNDPVHDPNGAPVSPPSFEAFHTPDLEPTAAEGTAEEGPSPTPTPPPALQTFNDPDIGWGEHFPLQWTDMMVAVSNGRWVEREVEREMWWEAVQVVVKEWGVRMGLCVRVLMEGGVEARGRDGGMWGESGMD